MLLLSFICINVINKVHSLTEFAWEISSLKNKPKAISSGCAKTKKKTYKSVVVPLKAAVVVVVKQRGSSWPVLEFTSSGIKEIRKVSESEFFPNYSSRNHL